MAITFACKTVGYYPRGVTKPIFPALSYSPASAQPSPLEPSVNHISPFRKASSSSSSHASLFGMHYRKSLSKLYFLTVYSCLIDRVVSSVMSIRSLLCLAPLAHLPMVVRRPIVWAPSAIVAI